LGVNILGTFTIESQPWLSSKTVDLTRDLETKFILSLEDSSLNGACMGRSPLKAILNATFSAAVELHVISDCNLLNQMMG
jgi:hypothetical protein